jgi:hypothetical protein
MSLLMQVDWIQNGKARCPKRGSERAGRIAFSAQSGRASGTDADDVAWFFHIARICALCFEPIEVAADSTLTAGFVI